MLQTNVTSQFSTVGWFFAANTEANRFNTYYCQTRPSI